MLACYVQNGVDVRHMSWEYDTTKAQDWSVLKFVRNTLIAYIPKDDNSEYCRVYFILEEREEFYHISGEYIILYLYETAIFYNCLRFQFQENSKSHLFAC